MTYLKSGVQSEIYDSINSLPGLDLHAGEFGAGQLTLGTHCEYFEEDPMFGLSLELREG